VPDVVVQQAVAEGEVVDERKTHLLHDDIVTIGLDRPGGAGRVDVGSIWQDVAAGTIHEVGRVVKAHQHPSHQPLGLGPEP
jgi:hypothetical protein